VPRLLSISLVASAPKIIIFMMLWDKSIRMQCYGRIPASPLSGEIRFFPRLVSITSHLPVIRLSAHHPTSRALNKKLRKRSLPPPPASAVLSAESFFLCCPNCLTFLGRTAITCSEILWPWPIFWPVCNSNPFCEHWAITSAAWEYKYLLVLTSNGDRGGGVAGMTKHKRREMQDLLFGLLPSGCGVSSDHG